MSEASGAKSAEPREDPAADPAWVMGPFGEKLTRELLPPAGTRRWVARRKAEVLAAVRGGLLSRTEACARYRLSEEELRLWERALDAAGVPGLRVTRVQIYRPVFEALEQEANILRDNVP